MKPNKQTMLSHNNFKIIIHYLFLKSLFASACRKLQTKAIGKIEQTCRAVHEHTGIHTHIHKRARKQKKMHIILYSNVKPNNEDMILFSLLNTSKRGKRRNEKKNLVKI